MDARDLFTASDAALRGVVETLGPAQLERPVPGEWSRREEHPVVRDIVFAQAYDEAWIPDLLAGRSVADGDPWIVADLLGDDPVAAYAAINDRATAAVAEMSGDPTLRFQYGDYPASEGFAHMAVYRALQAWDLAQLLGIPFHLSAEVLEGLQEHVVPNAAVWREWGVFPPEQEPIEGASDEVRVLRLLGRDAR